MKTAVITGASSGIGFAASAELIQKGYRIIGIGHDKARCEEAEYRLKMQSPEASVTMLCADLMQQREVERVANEIQQLLARENEDKLDVLINNAGCVRSWYTTTGEGYEQQFALNHLASFLLTYHLLPQLKHAGGKIIMTGSESHKHMRMHWNDLMLTRGYNPLTAYKQSKLANILFAKSLNERYIGDGVTAYVVDPGLVCTDIGCKNTGGLVDWIWKLRKKHGCQPEVPAKTYAYLCETNPAPRELYYHLCKPNTYSPQVNHGNADRLFAASEKLCGIQYPSWIQT
ncbi:MAG TPA: SDR family NAD(P)-dependent oxidoreductase [Clostridia bacterium]|nr:SDR family NAD(P)-dependent oxidoreductase [Clostridia bacterium]